MESVIEMKIQFTFSGSQVIFIWPGIQRNSLQMLMNNSLWLHIKESHKCHFIGLRNEFLAPNRNIISFHPKFRVYLNQKASNNGFFSIVVKKKEKNLPNKVVLCFGQGSWINWSLGKKKWKIPHLWWLFVWKALQ